MGPAGAGAAEPAEPPAAESSVMAAVSPEPLPAELLVAAAGICLGPAEPGAAEPPAEPAAAAAAESCSEPVAAAAKTAVPAQAVATAVYPAAPADQVVAAVEHTEPAAAQQEAARGSHSTAQRAAEAAEQPEAAEGGELAVAAADEAVEEAAATEQLAEGAGRPAVEAAAAKWSCFQIQEVHSEPEHPLELWAVSPPLAPNLRRSSASEDCEGQS